MRKRTVFNFWKIIVCLLVLTGPQTVRAMESEDCLMCHEDGDSVAEDLIIDADRYALTSHAELGCLTCHDTVTDEHPDEAVADSGVTCLDCHEEFGQQYLASVHAENAACSDCHNPHEVAGLAGVSAGAMNRQCLICHETTDILPDHDQWLPQANLHFEALPCITCHTSSPGYKIVLTIEKKQEQGVFRGYEPVSYDDLAALSESGGGTIIDINDNQYVSLAELRGFIRNQRHAGLRMNATLVPAELSHQLTTLDSRYDCTFCHASGPKTMQISILSLPAADGGTHELEVEPGAILEALYGTPDFYMTGITRSASLDIIGLIIICSGFIMPVGHGTLRFLTRNNRKHEKDEL